MMKHFYLTVAIAPLSLVAPAAAQALPIASSGAKFVQLQEDGLPILEFGEIAFTGADLKAITGGNGATIPASGVASAQLPTGLTISATAHPNF